MSTQTNERAFESYVEQILLTQSGWQKGVLTEWDVDRALFPARVLSFIQQTQGELWTSLLKQHGADLDTAVLTALVNELELKGTLHVLRKGFKFYGKTLMLAYFKPAHGLNYEVLERFKQNKLTVTRQVPCHPGKSHTVDLVFSLNGLPIATCELKNPGTGQTWQHAVEQYKTTRDPKAPLFSFKKRTLVHFAADSNEVYMTTQLQKEKTWFLPLNRGSHPGEIQCGKGNPVHPSGYRTGYFWESILQFDSFMDIVGSFMFIETHKAPDGKETHVMVFPRYHQLDAVRSLIKTARKDGPGTNYLIQHSAGSGKTNSIAWLSHRLAMLHNHEDQRVFDCVIVITDRRVLDQQLQDAIYQIDHTQGVVKAIDQDSKQLSNALIDGTKIIITTQQKFPFVSRALLYATGAKTQDDATDTEKAKAKEWEQEIASRHYAIIVDEAHSSQSGKSAGELKTLLGANAMSESEDTDDNSLESQLNQIIAGHGKQQNLSFFAFTATPKPETIENFGTKFDGSKPMAFHTYSMRQAIEEEFILDVLTNYTVYDTYFKLVKAADDDPALPKRRTAQLLSKFLSLHPHNIDQKTEIIVEHFRLHVMHRLNGRAKAMVVTSSRLQAVRYMKAFEKYIKQKNYKDIRPLVAFSGTVHDDNDGLDYTEPSMNKDCDTGQPISEQQLPKRFASPDYQVLLVANKYQTGFDQPLLHTMYVDKRLQGVAAVQTLSRLNRKIPGKDAPFVLDFVNKAQEIHDAFKPYYDTTQLEAESDPHKLNKVKHELDLFQIYKHQDIEEFAKIFYLPTEKQKPSDHARMQKLLQPAVDEYRKVVLQARRQEFRDKLSAYVQAYAFLSQIIPYGDPDLEKLYSYGRFLLPHLPSDYSLVPVKLTDEVSLQYYRIERSYSGPIILGDGPVQYVKSTLTDGSAKSKETEAPLSVIIHTLNEKFGTEFNDTDKLFFQQIKESACNDSSVINTAKSNPIDKFALGISKQIEQMMLQRLVDNDKIVQQYMDNKEFQQTVLSLLAKEIFKTIHSGL